MKRIQQWMASMQARLLVLLVTGMLVVSVLAMVSAAHSMRHEMGELLDAHLAQSAASLLMQANLLEDDEAVEDVPLLHRYATRTVFQIFRDGVLHCRSSNAPSEPITTTRNGFVTVQQADGSRWRVFAVHDAQHNTTVLVGEQWRTRDSIVTEVLCSMLVPLLLSLPVMALLVVWLVRNNFKPLRKLQSALLQRQPDDTHVLDAGPLPQEIQPLLDALNQLLARMARMLEHERRFTADAAHELRTPIAAIRTQAQVALGALHGMDARTDVIFQALQTTMAGCDRASHVVDQLLVLARLDAPVDAILCPSTTNTLRLSDAVQQLLADMAPMAWAKQQNLELHDDTDGQAQVPQATAALWGILLRNVVDNAIRYSPIQATVQVSLTHVLVQGTSQLQVCVQDSGPGMSAEDMNRLGERFFRVLGTEQSGSGLGWSIVRRIADLLGLSVQVQRSPTLGGLRVELRTGWVEAP
ncbi:sensor histidine kinase N-terminal domain-containing protein [Curvibacter sp. CHRR-16]|uniref:ATP-binding protein n=1 Tax=Curvibacter sp. CHRR-16 TaxID=2835872 RepID=UPI001BDAB202|nr:ATP-binding protein [Curvibacter sp. CHRR-16]MBT0570082.1 sensor histidine kinase N-terminal domain-containing protein [Curvibacter sp. CHRR-16]